LRELRNKFYFSELRVYTLKFKYSEFRFEGILQKKKKCVLIKNVYSCVLIITHINSFILCFIKKTKEIFTTIRINLCILVVLLMYISNMYYIYYFPMVMCSNVFPDNAMCA